MFLYTSTSICLNIYNDPYNGRFSTNTTIQIFKNMRTMMQNIQNFT